MHLRQFRRFTDLTINIPERAKLVVLAGPNGVGKSSLFDAMRVWSAYGGAGGGGFDPDPEYWIKGYRQARRRSNQIRFRSIFTRGIPGQNGDPARKAIYVRTAYRNDPSVEPRRFQLVGSMLETPLTTARRVIDNDVRVSENYERLAGMALQDVFNEITRKSWRARSRIVTSALFATRSYACFQIYICTGPAIRWKRERSFSERARSMSFLRWSFMWGGTLTFVATTSRKVRRP